MQSIIIFFNVYFVILIYNCYIFKSIYMNNFLLI
uniref:Uncharacterized protein n=1 Tax=Lophocladia kuetzingii TaxID=675577 RepID=A0A1Z1MPH2_9FLOR|nr:hypothetical protein [Lophocladia kuetzingii]ARW67675.1 hypothetical protein [Lophocladia kuetzingii]